MPIFLLACVTFTYLMISSKSLYIQVYLTSVSHFASVFFQSVAFQLYGAFYYTQVFNFDVVKLASLSFMLFSVFLQAFLTLRS